MNTRLVGFLTAVLIAFEGMPMTFCSAEQRPDTNAPMTGAEERIVKIYKLDGAGVEETGEELLSTMADVQNYGSDAEAATAQPFFAYSNDYYASRYGSEHYGHGYAYMDIISSTKYPPAYSDKKRELYDDFLSTCREFSTDYSDVHPYKIQLGDGGVSEPMYMIGKEDIFVSLRDTGINVGTEEGQKTAKSLVYETYYTFRNDHPEYYWLSNTISVFFYTFANTMIIVPQVFYEFISGDTRKNIDMRMQQSIDWFLEGVYGSGYYDPTNQNSYYVSAVLRKMLIEATEYGWEDITHTTPLDTGTAHSIVSMFDEDRSTLAVCESYAKSFQLLLNKLGIDSIFVTGNVGEKNEHHAWNMVKMPDNSFYNFDITWEDGEYEPFIFFAAGSDSFSTENGGHRPGSSASDGVDYLYDLPPTPESDYYDAAGVVLEMIPCPTPLPDMPLETFSPDLWAGSVKISDWFTDYVGKGLSGYVGTDNVYVEITKKGQEAVYGIDYVALNNGNRLKSFNTGIKPHGKIVYEGLEIYAVKGVQVVTKSVLTNDSGALVVFNDSMGKVVIGKRIRYKDQYLRDVVEYNGDYSRYGVEVFRPYFTVKKPDGTNADYNTDFICEYDGRYVFKNEYYDMLNGYIEDVFGAGTTGVDVFEKLVIRAINDVTVNYITYIKTASGQTGILPESNRSLFPGLYKTETLEAPLYVDVTLERTGSVVSSVADRELPDGCIMFIAAYKADGTLSVVHMVRDREYDHSISAAGDEAVIKAYVFGENQYPMADVQVMYLW